MREACTYRKKREKISIIFRVLQIKQIRRVNDMKRIEIGFGIDWELIISVIS